MSTEEPIQPQDPTQDDTTMQDAVKPTEESSVGDAGAGGGDEARASRNRPRLDLAVNSRERRRGKTMFGLVLGTLNKAKNEDKARNASDAAKKRQQIDQRLQDKLRKETDSVRRTEEAKKDKTLANRKEEDLQLKDSIHKLRRTRLPLLANFLSTSDQIPTEEDISSPPPSTNPLAPQARTHPPPIFYLPAILLPSQEAFLTRRKAEVKEAAEKEWAVFHEERKAGIEEIISLRQRVAEEETRKKSEQKEQRDTEPTATNSGADIKMGDAEPPTEAKITDTTAEGDFKKLEPMEITTSQPKDMDVDDESARTDGSKTLESDSTKGSSSTTAPAPPEAPPASEPKEEPTMMQADEDDAVEY